MSEIPFKNPGWAGNVGEYDLTEEQVRGTDFVGIRPARGRAPCGIGHVSVHVGGEGSRGAPL